MSFVESSSGLVLACCLHVLQIVGAWSKCVDDLLHPASPQLRSVVVRSSRRIACVGALIVGVGRWSSSCPLRMRDGLSLHCRPVAPCGLPPNNLRSLLLGVGS